MQAPGDLNVVAFALPIPNPNPVPVLEKLMTFTAYQCPESHQPLVLASQELITAINQSITDQQMLNVDGQTVEKIIEGGWLSEQTNRLYPIRDQIVCLLTNQALDLSSLPTS